MRTPEAPTPGAGTPGGVKRGAGVCQHAAPRESKSIIIRQRASRSGIPLATEINQRTAVVQ